jgi:hypothetical protein
MSRFAALALAVALVVAAGAGCSDGDDDGSGGSGSGSGDPTTTEAAASLPGPPADPAVIGTWTADGDDELVEALSEQGLDEVPTCTGGTVTLELGEDGGFTRTLAGTCAFADGDGVVEVVTSGGYATEGGELVLTDVAGSGTIRGADGEELALPAGSTADGGATPYEVTPDELHLTHPASDATLTLTRP